MSNKTGFTCIDFVLLSTILLMANVIYQKNLIILLLSSIKMRRHLVYHCDKCYPSH